MNDEKRRQKKNGIGGANPGNVVEEFHHYNAAQDFVLDWDSIYWDFFKI